MKSSSVLPLFLLPVVVAGCTGTEAPDPTPGDETGPAFIAATRVWDDTTITSYFHVLPSLDAGTAVDTSKALEVPGSARLYTLPDVGWFAVGGGESPTITRYVLDENDALVAEETISLQPYGVQSLWDTLYFVSPTKAYYPDRDGTQLVVWDPTAMEITGSIPLPDTVRDGYLANYAYASVRRGDLLLFSVGWFDWAETDSVLPETGLVVIDTTNDTVARVDVDDRCGGITQPLVMTSGDAYFASSALAAAAHRLDRLATEPCVLRVNADEDRFDPGYALSLADLTGGALAGEPVPGPDGSIFLRVFDESLAEVDPEGYTWGITGQLAWRWSKWEVGSDLVTPIAALEPSTADVVWFEVDGRVFGTETTEDYSETTLIELTAEGGPKAQLTAPGFLHGLARVR